MPLDGELAVKGMQLYLIRVISNACEADTDTGPSQEVQDPFSFSAPRFTGPRRHAGKLYFIRHHSAILST
jgi:hypothetical protein